MTFYQTRFLDICADKAAALRFKTAILPWEKAIEERSIPAFEKAWPAVNAWNGEAFSHNKLVDRDKDGKPESYDDLYPYIDALPASACLGEMPHPPRHYIEALAALLDRYHEGKKDGIRFFSPTVIGDDGEERQNWGQYSFGILMDAAERYRIGAMFGAILESRDIL